ncbi:MAG TPA: alpha/beta hydrolase-fold protein [Sphingomicrobium sp.]|nr:alpha/beta hydrolase-fold protein [Sphingomicrobium sp.]
MRKPRPAPALPISQIAIATLMALIACLALFAPPLGAIGASAPAISLSRGYLATEVLGNGETNWYSVELEEGGAILGEADQEGVDVALDIYDPAGRKLLTIDSPNGAVGPEPIDFTAPVKGTFRMAIRQSSGSAPGRYKIAIRDILTADANAARLAALRYPSPALASLWQQARKEPAAVERFVAGRTGKGPLIEAVAGDPSARRVTYLYQASPDTEAVRVSAGPHGASGGLLMSRFLQSSLFYASEIVPSDARFTYGFASIESQRLGPQGEVLISSDHFSTDPLNPKSFGGRALLELPDAKPQSELADRPAVSKGRLSTARIRSAALGETRPISIYQSPTSDRRRADLLIIFDGQLYASKPDEDGVPVPTILDNMVAEGRIGPVVALFIDNLPGRRDQDLSANRAFNDFAAKELVAWARAHYRIADGPRHVVAIGSSLGGFAAVYCAFRHPENVGNVLSQSGAFWLTEKGATWRSPYPNPSGTGIAIELYRTAPRLAARFALSVGRFEDSTSLFAANREMRDVLLAKHYPVDYVELNGGHEPIAWRSSFANSLTALIGTRRKGIHS